LAEQPSCKRQVSGSIPLTGSGSVLRAADVRAGSRPAPELLRTRRLARQRGGLEPELEGGAQDDAGPSRDPVSVLAEVFQRDGSMLPATETLRNELSNADHLGVLGAIWYDLARRAQARRFERALRDCLPAACADAAIGDPARTWLWRSLREAEAAGLDADNVLHAAVAARPLDGARHAARVIDARLQARAARENAIRADHEARAATGVEIIQRHQALAGMWRAMQAKAMRIANMLAEAQETRRQWDALTEPTRRVAIAADLELRRRYPDQVIEPLRSGEPPGIRRPERVSAATGREVWIQETLDGAIHLAQADAENVAEPAGERPLTSAQREALG
jgi:hypothetical protein